MDELTVKLDDVKECSTSERNIFIVILQPSNEPQLILNKEYCAFLPPKEIIYNLRYFPLNETSPKSKIQLFLELNGDKLNNACNELLIYITKMSLDVVKTVLDLFKSFKLKKTIYSFAPQFSPSNYNEYLRYYKIAMFETIKDKGGYTYELPDGMEIIKYFDTMA
jgi:hypothetical protein